MANVWISRWVNLHVLSLILNFVNLTVYAAIGTATVFSILRQAPNTLVPNCIAAGSGLLLLVTELHLSRLAVEYFRFITTLRGRGLVYVILGFISYQDSILINMLVCYYSTALGICYCILSFLPQLLPLNDIKRNWRAYRQYCEELTASFCTEGTAPRQGSVYNRHQPSTIRAGPITEDKSRSVLNGYSRESYNLEKDHAQLAMEINDALLQVQYSDFTNPIVVDPPSSRPPSDTESFFPKSNISSQIGTRNNSIVIPLATSSQHPFPLSKNAGTIRNISGARLPPQAEDNSLDPNSSQVPRPLYYHHQHHRSHPNFTIPEGENR